MTSVVREVVSMMDVPEGDGERRVLPERPRALALAGLTESEE